MHADGLTPSVGTMITKFWIGSYLILSKTKWPPFHRRYFRMHFVNEIYCMVIEISLKCVPKGPIDKKQSISLDNGLAPNRRQAISEPMLIPFADAYMWHYGNMSYRVNMWHILRMGYLLIIHPMSPNLCWINSMLYKVAIHVCDW